MTSEKKLCEKCSRAWMARSSDENCPFCRVESLENAVDAALPRMNVITALRRHGQPHRPDAADKLYETQLALEALMESNARFTRPEFSIGGVYFPDKGEADFIFESEVGQLVITQQVSPELGQLIAKMFYPCVYMTAGLHPNGATALRSLAHDMLLWLQEPGTGDTEKAKAINRHHVQGWYTKLRAITRG